MGITTGVLMLRLCLMSECVSQFEAAGHTNAESSLSNLNQLKFTGVELIKINTFLSGQIVDNVASAKQIIQNQFLKRFLDKNTFSKLFSTQMSDYRK